MNHGIQMLLIKPPMKLVLRKNEIQKDSGKFKKNRS